VVLLKSRRLYGFERSKVYLNYARWRNNLQGVNLAILDPERDLDSVSMKFDVVIGNPPYQRPKHSEGNKNNQPLWLDFLEKSGNLLAPGGILSMLVPSQVAKSTRWNSPGKGFQALQWGNMLSIQTGLEKWFNVGTKISLVTVTTGIQGVLTVDGQEIDVSKRPWIPTKTNPEAFSILDKISNQSNKLEFKLGLHHMDEKNSFGFWRLNQTFGFNPIMTSTRDKSILNRMWIGHNAKDTNQAEKLILLMKSKLFTAFRQLTFYEPNFAHLLLSGLTFPDVIPTTDSEVFDAYGLTQEEIIFIDSLTT